MRIRMKALLFFFQSLLIYASTRRGGVAEWSCSGLQLRGRRFDSDLRLHLVKARVVKSVDTGDLKSPAHKACQFESGLGHHSYTSKYGAYKEPSVKLVFLCLQKSVTIQCTKKREHIDSLKNNISFVYHDKGGNK